MREITNTFKAEFGFLEDKFAIIEERLSDLGSSAKDCIYHPGVYIYHLDDQVIKVGRHLTNCRKRALEHISSNTRNEKLEMKMLVDNPDCKVTLLVVRDQEDSHWVAAVEIYMERELKPIIKSKRN